MQAKEKASFNQADYLLRTDNLVRHYNNSGLFGSGKGVTRAVDGVSLYMKDGETMGLVGESGCGKSTLAGLILRLIEPTSGKIYYRGMDITNWQGEKLRLWRRNIQVIFQDTHASLNPRMKIGTIIGETLRNFEKHEAENVDERVEELLTQVGLDPGFRDRYPHQFSGGQRQRVSIARALALKPGIIICDEAVASLDVSIQAQVLNLLKDLQGRYGFTYLFISHDLAAVEYISKSIAVMYLGKIVEIIRSNLIKEHALHPYTRSLLAALPLPDPSQRLIYDRLVKGDPPNPANPPQGCRFHPRCHLAEKICSSIEPELQLTGKRSDHQVACHLV